MTKVFTVEGVAISDYYDGALFNITRETARYTNTTNDKDYDICGKHHDWDAQLADAMYQADADGKRVRITAEVLDD